MDFVPAPPNNNEAGAVGGAQPVVPDKKKKKEKANLKPKLNFNPHSVTGSYFGSKRQKEDEEVVQDRTPSRSEFDIDFITGVPAEEAAEADPEPGAEQVDQCEQRTLRALLLHHPRPGHSPPSPCLSELHQRSAEVCVADSGNSGDPRDTGEP